MKLPEHITEEKVSKLYNAIDYKKAFDNIRYLADLEWNGSITIVEFRDNVNEVISVISEKESGSVTLGELRKCKTWEDLNELKQKKESK
tara:strand:+ start:55 stop:321 length:267 start_codon:yes stop_codon:yes gene_type:complete